MGSDELALITKTSPRFDRAALLALVTAHWSARGARLSKAQRWSKKAVWTTDTQQCFAVAVSPASTRGWVTLVESVQDSLSVDGALSKALSARAPTWVSWSFDHAATYGQKRLSRSGAKEPVDLGEAQAYASLSDVQDWTFLVFDGAEPMRFERWAPTARTKSNPLPPDADEELSSAFGSAVRSLRVEEGIAILGQLGARIGHFEILMVFDSRYPIEYEATANAVARLGSVIADATPLPAWAAARLLEVAAVLDDGTLRTQAERALAACPADEGAEALAEAAERFAERGDEGHAERFAAWRRGRPPPSGSKAAK